jgi:hypothetical protein
MYFLNYNRAWLLTKSVSSRTVGKMVLGQRADLATKAILSGISLFRFVTAPDVSERGVDTARIKRKRRTRFWPSERARHALLSGRNITDIAGLEKQVGGRI